MTCEMEVVWRGEGVVGNSSIFFQGSPRYSFEAAEFAALRANVFLADHDLTPFCVPRALDPCLQSKPPFVRTTESASANSAAPPGVGVVDS